MSHLLVLLQDRLVNTRIYNSIICAKQSMQGQQTNSVTVTYWLKQNSILPHMTQKESAVLSTGMICVVLSAAQVHCYSNKHQ